MRIALLALCLAIASTARADTETTWMKVLLDGRKIGHLESRRVASGELVTTTERMELSVDRSGVALGMSTVDTSVETQAGKPLEFASTVTLAGVATEIRGRVVDGHAEVTIGSGERVETRRIPWPQGAVLAEGARRIERTNGLAAGTRYDFTVFEPGNLIAVPVQVAVHGTESVGTLFRRERLVRLEQRVMIPGSPLTMRSWVTPDFELRRASMPLLGLELQLIACSETCARAANQPADILERILVEAPRRLSREEARDGMRYSLRVHGEDAVAPATTGEQRVSDGGAPGRFDLVVDPEPAVPDRTPPTEGEQRATRWLESDDPAIVALAREAAGDAGDAATIMRRLEQRVREHIADKSMRIGYASARETLDAREGDCTEHALLLAALGRAVGVPTRLVSGIAYTPAFAGREHVFVPHAWVQAWVDGRWVSYDAALAGFDAGHIAFATGDGDPAGFYAAVGLLGNVSIERAEALEATP